MADLLCCAACRRFPMELTVIDASDARGAGQRSCELTCGAHGHRIERDDDVCSSCTTLDVETGYFFCPGCERFYFIGGGIPRLLTEHFGELLDLSLPQRFPDAFDPRRQQLEAFMGRISARQSVGRESEWNLEDVNFWENDVYGDARETQVILERVAQGRRDAGDRTYPRERALFRRLRSEVSRGTVLDLGCGLAQTIRVVWDPDEFGYTYIGADLSVSALTTNRRSLGGEFVQCTADRAPLRDECVDAVLMLGTLHHLANHEEALRGAVSVVRPGGWIGLHEVVVRHGLTKRFRRLVGMKDEAESAHNDAVDRLTLHRCLSTSAETVFEQRSFSPLRGILVPLLRARMQTRPWLTKLVVGLDALCLATLGRLWSLFEGREVLLLARKHGTRAAEAVEGAPVAR